MLKFQIKSGYLICIKNCTMWCSTFGIAIPQGNFSQSNFESEMEIVMRKMLLQIYINIQSKNQKTAHCGVRLSASSSQKLWGMNIKTYMPENRGIKAIPRSSAGRFRACIDFVKKTPLYFSSFHII